MYLDATSVLAPPPFVTSVLAEPPVMVGLTGKRGVGKSTVADIFEAHGFGRTHAFDAGKHASETYFEYVTGDPERAERMVWGDLKDQPCWDLPLGKSPRYFMEKFGRFMGVEMGIDWTLAMEIEVAKREAPGSPIIVESVIYEADWFKRAGGKIVRIERPGFESPVGCESDGAQAKIKADHTIVSTDLASLKKEARWLAQDLKGGGG